MSVHVEAALEGPGGFVLRMAVVQALPEGKPAHAKELRHEIWNTVTIVTQDWKYTTSNMKQDAKPQEMSFHISAPEVANNETIVCPNKWHCQASFGLHMHRPAWTDECTGGLHFAVRDTTIPALPTTSCTQGHACNVVRKRVSASHNSGS